ncbi:unnamed protein product [Notodromas monacha]|uniref:Caprin-1 dimerization domain-containing protein n=1 Tax=Notodromas monacha TaxID=399045 RepID=A0A7R9BHW6_9CRUS|nr:unnamed protein product [Notodromas monacha]CAG0914967.1 unnamed protein product [Notodromas monacha]
MPSAAAAKLEKHLSSEALDPFKQCAIFCEKKVRNLEKRKGKLDAYRESSNAGKELNEDQKAAVSKYGEVEASLELMKEVSKQINSIHADSIKQQKKQARREIVERSQADIQRCKTVLIFQEIFLNLEDEVARNDFLAGNNKACKITAEQLTIIDELYRLLSPVRDQETAGKYHTLVAAAAEHWHDLLEGKQKEFAGITYAAAKELLFAINESGYFDQPRDAPQVETNGDAHDYGKDVVEGANGGSLDVCTVEDERTYAVDTNAHSIESTPEPVHASPSPQPVPPPHTHDLHPPPETIEDSLFSAAAPYNQQLMDGIAGNITFIHDSEIGLGAESQISAHLQAPVMQPKMEVGVPTMLPNQPSPVITPPIPTQTFTNQNFSTAYKTNSVYHSASPVPPGMDTMPNPPPPIPMPPSAGNLDQRALSLGPHHPPGFNQASYHPAARDAWVQHEKQPAIEQWQASPAQTQPVPAPQVIPEVVPTTTGSPPVKEHHAASGDGWNDSMDTGGKWQQTSPEIPPQQQQQQPTLPAQPPADPPNAWSKPVGCWNVPSQRQPTSQSQRKELDDDWGNWEDRNSTRKTDWAEESENADAGPPIGTFGQDAKEKESLANQARQNRSGGGGNGGGGYGNRYGNGNRSRGGPGGSRRGTSPNRYGGQRGGRGGYYGGDGYYQGNGYRGGRDGNAGGQRGLRGSGRGGGGLGSRGGGGGMSRRPENQA